MRIPRTRVPSAPMDRPAERDRGGRSPARAARDRLVRGAAGGFLFGVPLLYTMEVWWYGSWVHPGWMLGALLLSLGAVVVLVRTGAFRDTRRTGWRDGLIDAVELVAIALVCSAAVLVLLREISTGTSAREALGKIVFEAIPFAIGAALAGQLFARTGDDEDEQAGAPPEATIGRTVADAGAAATGALVVAFSIAPTDEVPMIGAVLTPGWLLAVVAASLVISYAIVFEAGFADQAGRRAHEGPFQRPLAETVGAYLIALATAGAMLAFFQRIGPGQSWETWVTAVVTLGLPAAIGGAAGRLAV